MESERCSRPQGEKMPSHSPVGASTVITRGSRAGAVNTFWFTIMPWSIEHSFLEENKKIRIKIQVWGQKSVVSHCKKWVQSSLISQSWNSSQTRTPWIKEGKVDFEINLEIYPPCMACEIFSHHNQRVLKLLNQGKSLVEWKHQIFQGLSGTVSDLTGGNPKHCFKPLILFGVYELQENSKVSTVASWKNQKTSNPFHSYV